MDAPERGVTTALARVVAGLAVAVGVLGCAGPSAEEEAAARSTVSELIAADMRLHDLLDEPVPPEQVADVAAAALEERLATLDERTALVWTDERTPAVADRAEPYLAPQAASGDVPKSIDARLVVDRWRSLDVGHDRITATLDAWVQRRRIEPSPMNPMFDLDLDADGWTRVTAETTRYEVVVVREDDGWRLAELDARPPV